MQSIKGNTKLYTFINSVVDELYYIDKRPEKCIDHDEFKNGIVDGKILLIDLRRRFEIDIGKIKTGQYVNIPLHDLDEALKMSPEEFKRRYGITKPDKNDPNIVIHCLAGVRSTTALAIASDNGYNRIRHYKGGWTDWYLKELLSKL